MRTFGIIGFPLSHSFSQKYFTEKFAAEGITDAVFNAYPMEHIAQLTQLLESEQTLEGFCITIPHKRNVLPWLSHVSPAAEQMNACNCVRVKGGRLFGYNTDCTGFQRSFTPQLQSHHTQALILGTGGAAAAIEYTLKQLGMPYKYVSRTPHENYLTYDMLTADIMAAYLVIINCTPLGTYPDVETAPPIPYELVTPQHYLYDVVYNPPLTRFLQHGTEKGAVVKNGYDMLTIQAEENWKIWNDVVSGE
ncbi:shikimate dehydrogenase family protein [Deminuibacter soli]|uniref:Shikimate dehydrogenase n=1 Tax=Deminuibacter soli TaxID=2291815 RepID=A0A3E1NDT6_9BACT|nr:shikimate dehydrogenase [Deminuibacter soli]RFM26129.1 shikimate dehydrogenase [Deminuibacter soli]